MFGPAATAMYCLPSKEYVIGEAFHDWFVGRLHNGVPFAAGIEVSEAKWISTGFSSAVTGGDYSFLFRALESKGRLELVEGGPAASDQSFGLTQA